MERVFITGGASGLGRELALQYAARGAQVCIGDLHTQRGAATLAELQAAGGEARFELCDVTQEGDLQRVADALQSAWGGVDIVINNAGVAGAGAIEDVPLSDWEWIIQINLLGVVRGCKVFTPMFKRQGGGHFINIASMAGVLNPPLMAPYNAVKAAVMSVSETLNLELSADNIGVTAVCPSFFKTNLAESLRSTAPGVEGAIHKLFKNSALTAEEVAAAIIKAADAGDVYCLPHKDGRHAERLKRLLPANIFSKLLQRQTARMLKLNQG